MSSFTKSVWSIGSKVVQQHGLNTKGIGGFLAEHFVVESYNLMATSKGSNLRAVVSSTIAGCGKKVFDIVIVEAGDVSRLTKDNVGELGKAFAQVKTGTRALSAAKNPRYANQLKVIESRCRGLNTLHFGGISSIPIHHKVVGFLRSAPKFRHVLPIAFFKTNALRICFQNAWSANQPFYLRL